jgi:hypothetical protein
MAGLIYFHAAEGPIRPHALGCAGEAGRFLMASAVLGKTMSNSRIISAACFAALALTTPAAPATAATTCIFDWAVPGYYEISGRFRGQVETVTARLTNDCRVTIGLPGVFTGGPLRRNGRCLAFSFRVQDERQTFTARWCGSYGVVPWQGRDVRATIVKRPGRSIREGR